MNSIERKPLYSGHVFLVHAKGNSMDKSNGPNQESITLKQRSVQLHTCARISK